MNVIITNSGLMAVHDMNEHGRYYCSSFQKHSTKELLKMQSRGATLTREEKNRVQKEAEARRKRRN